MIDITWPVDSNLILKGNEKLDNYSELRLARMWVKEICIGSIITGALGSILKDIDIYLKKLDISFIAWGLYKNLLYLELPIFWEKYYLLNKQKIKQKNNS